MAVAADAATTRSASLEEWARRIARWRRRADVLVYFNNNWEGFAVDNARSLRRRFRNELGMMDTATKGGATRWPAQSRRS